MCVYNLGCVKDLKQENKVVRHLFKRLIHLFLSKIKVYRLNNTEYKVTMQATSWKKTFVYN